MYDNKAKSSLFDAAIPAAIGAGVITSFALAQGQHPAIAIGITIIATLFAVICEKFALI
jgi:small neutral amino acid transporter SnatA (MarC family)